MDSRLFMAASLYDRCELGCDIGTDHGLLPCYLLRHGICDCMIVSDLSEKALAHARTNLQLQHLEARAFLRTADGLQALSPLPQGFSRAGCISLMGMGGETVSAILKEGRSLLRGAALVVSVHTEQGLTRRTLQEIGYSIAEETLCFDNGRYYIFWKAVPGSMQLTEEEADFGTPLLFRPSPCLEGYLLRRIDILQKQLAGLMRASEPEEADMAGIRRALDFYTRRCRLLTSREAL